MIALLGQLMHKAGIRQALDDTAVNPRFRTDEVDVRW